MIGYKATDKDGNCRGFHYEVGKTYTKDTKKENMKCCTNTVFHFCRELFAIEKESDYKLSESRIFEVIAGDFVRSGDKYGTNVLTIIREITGEEKKDLLNSGDYNSGNWNSGNRNSGNWNSGNCNSGNWNSGNWNSGNWNSGNSNSGNRNSGNWNSGNWNSGNRNSGNRNSGNRNSGDCNSGNWNSGNCNSGDYNSGDCNSGNWNSGNSNSGNRNSGDCNSGNWNSGNCNSGYFNSNEGKIRMFNKEINLSSNEIKFPIWCYFNPNIWVSYDTATEEEKKEHKLEIEICGGFLKTLEYKQAWKIAYNKTNDEEKKQLFKLPNYDCYVFEEISGIDTRKDYERLSRS